MAGFIEGVSRDQTTLFSVRLDDWIGEDHLARVVDQFVDQLDLTMLGFQRHVAARTGRPGYHPAVLLKLFIYGYAITRTQDELRRLFTPLPLTDSFGTRPFASGSGTSIDVRPPPTITLIQVIAHPKRLD